MRHTISLTRNGDFRRLYARGKNLVATGCVIYCARNRLGINRLGLTTGKKIGGAVQRNRARRRLQEAYRLMTPSLRTGYDLVIVARARALTMPFIEMDREMRGLLRRHGVLP